MHRITPTPNITTKHRINLAGEPIRKVKKGQTAKDPRHRPPSPQFNTSLGPVEKPDQAASRTKKKKRAAGAANNGGGLSSMPMRQQPANNSSSLSDLQSVEEFRHFLLRNDS